MSMANKRFKRYAINAVAAKKGGAAVYITNLVKGIAKFGRRGSIYYIFLPQERTEGLGDLPPNIRPIISGFANRSFLHRLVWDQIYLRWFIMAKRIDTVFCNGSFGIFLSPCRQILKVDNSLYFSDIFARDMSRKAPLLDRIAFYLRKRLVELSIFFSETVMVPSRDLESLIKKKRRFRSKKIIVNPLGFDERVFSDSGATKEKAAEKGDAFKIYSHGHYNYHKNFETLMKALPLVEEKLKRSVLLVMTTDEIKPGQRYNYGNTNEISSLVDRLNLRDKIVSLGAVPYSVIPEVYRSCDLYVQPSYCESFSHALVESMAFGAPRLVSDVGIHREICGDSALYFSTFDERDLADKCCDLLEDDKKREVLAARGIEMSKEFSWDRHVKRTLRLLEKRSYEDTID